MTNALLWNSMPVKMNRLESKKNKKNNAFYLRTKLDSILSLITKKKDFIHDISGQQRHFVCFSFSGD